MWFCDGLVLVERPDAWDSEAFDIACCRGDLDAAKSLLAKGHVDIHYEWDLPFVGACRNGHLAVAQWLHGLGDVDIHTYADRPFQMACCGGFLATAKWLYSLGGVNIHCAYSQPLWGAVIRGHAHVGRWLLALDPEYVWLAAAVNKLKTWSSPRDAWMRAVVR